MGVRGDSAPTLTHQNLTFLKFWTAISGGIHWVAPSVCMPPGDLGVSWADILRWPDFCNPWHKWTPNFPKSQNFLKFDFLFSPLIVLYSHLVTGKGTIGRSLGGPVTGLQRRVSDLFLRWQNSSFDWATTLLPSKCQILLLFLPYAPYRKG